MVKENVMRKLVLAAAVTAIWVAVFANPWPAAAAWVLHTIDMHDDGSYTEFRVSEAKGSKYEDDVLVLHFDKDDKLVFFGIFEIGNPTPDSDHRYGDKPPGHKDGPGLGNPKLLLNPKVEPSLTKWTRQAFRIERGMGLNLTIQGRGSLDDLINPGPDDAGGGGDDDDAPGRQPLSPEDRKEIAQDLEAVEQLLKQQFPGLELSLLRVDYVRLHNPVPDDPTETQSRGGGRAGTPATNAASAGSAGTAGQPSMADAARDALINPNPSERGSMDIDNALLGPSLGALGIGLPLAAPTGAPLRDGNLMQRQGGPAVAAGNGPALGSAIPGPGASQVRVAPMAVQALRVVPSARANQAPNPSLVGNANGLNCLFPCQ